MFSKACIYGIQAAIYLAQQQKLQSDRQYIPVVEIAQTLGIPFQFLKKIMQSLSEKGLTVSQRSAKGGMALARSAENISIFEVIQAIDGAAILVSDCILSFPGCGDEKPCPLHHQWAVERKRLRTMFETTTLEFLAGNVSQGLTRLGISTDKEE
jgi:Rrf2 family transcriptional regulator, iron-sulfur cluster assembly transcription factor